MDYGTDKRNPILKNINPGEAKESPAPPVVIMKTAGQGREATLLLQPSGRNTLPLSREYISARLESNGIVHGVNWPLIEDLCVRPVYYHTFVIARHTPPEKGADGYVEYLFATSESLAPKDNGDGTVDYKATDYVHEAEEGQILCRRYPPRQGAGGMDIFGAPIDGLFGENPMNPRGKNTALSEDETELRALVAGRVRHSFGIVSITESLTLDAVNNSTGNIDFAGDVLVKGDIAPGFHIKAGGSIAVSGNVEGAYLEAGNNIKVSNGIYGMEQGSVSAGGDISCKFIENSTVLASGSVRAESILFSNVRCNGDILLQGGKGALIGGQASVTGKVSAKVIGSPRNVSTFIKIITPEADNPEISGIAEQLCALNSEIASIFEKLSRHETRKRAGAVNQLPPDQVQELTSRYAGYEKRRAELDEKLSRLREKWPKEARGGCRVECRGTIYANTAVEIDGNHLLLTDDYARSGIRLTGDGVVVSPL